MSAETNLPERRRWDVVIVGAGPAGLFAALGIASATSKRILIVDAGADLDERDRSRPEDYVQGVGGAGLYSDGKLCLSLEVGGHLKSVLPDSDKVRLLQELREVFGSLIEDDQPRPIQEADLERARREAGAVGLGFKYYPVLHVGTERCADVIRAIREALLRRGVTILPKTRVESLDRSPVGSWTLELQSPAGVRRVGAEAVVLALGKVGAETQARLCRDVGVAVSSRPMYLGLRVETEAAILEPLFGLAKDPKFHMQTADGGRVKTHCATRDGAILPLRYEGFPLAGGHSFHGQPTGRSGFSVLWDGFGIGSDAYLGALALMKKASVMTGGRLLVQTLADLRAGRPSTAAALAGIHLTTKTSVPGDARGILPEAFFPLLFEFIDRLERLAPGLNGEATVVYAPAIEWWMQRIEVQSRSLETSARGLYVCGDGSGWSQGIVHSAATGILVAEGIAGRPISLGRSSLRPLVRLGEKR